MWKEIIILILFSILLIGNCKKSDNPVDVTFSCDSENNRINLVFKYGVMTKNILNTFNCSYQKYLVLDAPITINFKLAKKEIDSIYIKMNEIDFFDYPDTFIVDVGNDTITAVTPSLKYYFYVELDSSQKELYWNDGIMKPDIKAEKLRYLIEFIKNVIESKDEYKELPEPRGGYI